MDPFREKNRPTLISDTHLQQAASDNVLGRTDWLPGCLADAQPFSLPRREREQRSERARIETSLGISTQDELDKRKSTLSLGHQSHKQAARHKTLNKCAVVRFFLLSCGQLIDGRLVVVRCLCAAFGPEKSRN